MLRGIDISEFQPNTDFNALKNQLDFVIIRSSYGDGFTDKSFAKNRDQVRQAGIPHGFYHYAYPQFNTPKAEAEWFLSVVNPQKGELLCLDFEEHWSGDSVAWCKEFLDHVSQKLNGYKPLIYLNFSTIQSLDWSPVINSGYGLWLADWDNNSTGPGRNTSWPVTAIRQYTDSANFNGVSGKVDADIFYGDLDSFKKYGYQGGVSVSVSPVTTSSSILAVQPLSQRDSRWSGQRLGTVNGTTIGSHGCVITDMAMLSTYYNHPILPNQIDDILTDKGLYFDGNLFVNGSITKLFPDIKFDKVVFCETTPAPLDEIKKYLDEGKPVVAALINQGIRHYILIVGYEGNRIFANDPWQGDQVAINDRWGDPGLKILQVNFFSGPVPKKTSPQPTPIEIPPTPAVDNSQVDSLNSQIASLNAANQNLQNQLLSANSQMSDLGSQIAALKASLNSHPNDGPHMDDGGVIKPIPVPTPTPIVAPPVDVSPIKDTIESGLSNLQEIISQLIISKEIVPETPVEPKPQISFVDSLKSRKFLLSLLAAGIAFLNSNLNLGLSIQQVLIVIAPLLTFIGVEGVADIIQRAKTPAPSK